MNTGYILGINGWFTRSHDASACIVRNGEILAMVEEERFVRKKHAYDKIPYHSILWCLQKVGITLDEIEKVAVGWDYKKLYREAKVIEPKLENLIDIFFPKNYFKYSKKPEIELISHHLAHAASSFYLSGMENASILVIDGQGESASTTFAVGKGKDIEILWSLPIEYSLGYFYEAVSDFIGLGLDAAGKTMGFAPYGEAKYHFGQFSTDKNGYKVSIDFGDEQLNSLDQQLRIVEGWENQFIKSFGKIKPVNYYFRNLFGDIHKKVKISRIEQDIAASAQRCLEDILLHCVEVLVAKTGINNLCMAGGVALNCSTNTKILRSGIVKDIFIPPFTNDAGVSIGAALLISGKRSNSRLATAYFGPSYSDKEIISILNKLGIKYKFFGENIEEKVAKLLVEGRIVSWFQGAVEIGPRALGNRSILANPILEETHKKVNEAKNREKWRPLAPSILWEGIDEYLEEPIKSPFMLHTFYVKNEKQKNVPAIVHVDGSTRPQTVNKSVNPKYYKLISSFKRLSGIPMVLNTSFNGAKEAMVCTPLNAITSFYSNSTDYLAIGNFLIKK